MFGYVKTDFPNLYVKDVTLYKAMYCGLCKGIGKSCGQRGRLVLNYDLTFLSILLHNLLDLDIKVEPQHCIIHAITKRPVAVVDSLTERISALNVILARYKLNDDVNDDGKGRAFRLFINQAYKKAKKSEPELDNIVKSCYKDLISYEKTGGDSVDISADPFGRMMSEIVRVLAGKVADENLLSLAYSLGKWIYLIDAIDDYDKDVKKKSFNVFVNTNKEIKSKQEYIDENKQELVQIFGGLLFDIAERAKNLNYKFNHDLIDNVLLAGLRIQTRNILENKKCENTTKF